MVAITATNSATPSLPLQRTDAPVRRARQDADEAQAEAKVQREQANQAELESSMRNLAARLQEVEGLYSRSRTRNARTVIPPSFQDYIVSQYNASLGERMAAGTALKTRPDADPVRNAQGQPTGRIVDLVA
jgi:multidrug resistance efflux pump